MYVQLMADALDDQPGSEATAGLLLARVNHCRVMLAGRGPGSPGPMVETLVDHLAYDVALVRFARVLGIATDIESFRLPNLERARLESAVIERGYQLTP